MKRWYLIIPLLLLCSPLLIIGYFMGTYGYSFSEAAECLKHAAESNTKFREVKYSESAFHEVKLGAKGSEVFDLVGLPLERHDDDTKWCYSLPVGGTQYYHERTFIMDHGKVAGIICRFHTPQTKD